MKHSLDDIKTEIYRLIDNETDPRISTVADNLNVSVRSIQRQFKAEGETFKDFVTTTKLEKVTALFTVGRTVKQAMLSIGVVDPSIFSAWVKKNTGFTPRRYRDQLVKL